MIFGYARVSTDQQSLDRQIKILQQYNCDKIYQEKVSGVAKTRKELDMLLEVLREGDVLVVESFSRLARSLKDLLNIVSKLESRGVAIISDKEKFDMTTSTGKLMFNVFAALAEFERDLIIERTNEGLSAARSRGKHGGRPKLDKNIIDQALVLYDSGKYTVKEIAEIVGIGRSTIYHHLKLREKSK
ncbi:MAG: recombinase family protein [Saccharofermentanales bacterium]|jgi:DNA invertase Pin-like site-specific DNA recombinase